MTVPEWIAQIGFPINVTTNYGADVTFVLKTNGTDSLSFQWYKNGSELSGATSTSIAYSNVSCPGGEAGSYSVVVSNMAISQVVTGAMTLTVLDPYFTLQPSPAAQTIDEGSTVVYTVAAAGSPTISYQWQRNGVDLTDGTTAWGSVIAGSSTDTLTISNLKTEDGTNSPGSGLYRAVATTSAGGCSTPSQQVTLAVAALPRPVLESIELFGGGYRLTFSGPSGQAYDILYTTDLVLPLSSWTVLYTDNFLGGTQFYDDFSADPQRFYVLRIVYP